MMPASAVTGNQQAPFRCDSRPRLLEGEACPQAHLPGRLILRRGTSENLGDWCAEIRIRCRAGQLYPLVVHQDRLGVEEVEDVREQGHVAAAAESQRIRGLEVDITLKWRSRLEAVNRLDAGAAWPFRNFTAVRVVRIGGQCRQWS